MVLGKQVKDIKHYPKKLNNTCCKGKAKFLYLMGSVIHHSPSSDGDS